MEFNSDTLREALDLARVTKTKRNERNAKMKCYQNRGIHGMVKLANGTDIYLIEDAHFSENGVYSALGEDEEGNDWEVEWEVLPDYNADGEEDDACDWENPVYARNNNESFYD